MGTAETSGDARRHQSGAPRTAEGFGRPELVYLVACAVLSLLLGIQTVSHRWGADVWEHAAVVHDLAENPADPDHPMLPVEAPHEFAVPSAVLAAAIVAGAGVGVFDAMVVLAALNLGLLLGGVWLFVRTVRPRSRWTPLLALGLALFLWGVNPWGYSGFLHLNQIGQSLPYPSAFGLGAALLALAAYGRWLGRGGPGWLAASLLLTPLVVLSHPVAALLLAAGTGGLLLRHLDRGSAWIAAAGMASAGLLAALAWPYYPFFSVIQASHLFDSSNQVLYEHVLARTFPLVLGVGAILARLRRDRRDPLAVSVLALAAIYGAGFLLGRWSLGRVMSPLALLLHVALADWITGRGGELRRLVAAPGARGLLARAALVVLAGLAVLNMAPGFARTLPPALLPPPLANDPRLAPIDHRHRLLAGRIGEGEVVLARPRTGWPVPAYGGKILAPAQPDALVDYSDAQSDAAAFFAPEADERTRREIVDRWNVRWILIDASQPAEARLLPELSGMTRVAAQAHDLHLLEVRGRP